MTEHVWAVCNMCGPMIRCGFCGNNCCNGGSGSIDGKKCPDDCNEAYAIQKAETPPTEIVAEWDALKAKGETWHQLYDAGKLPFQRADTEGGERG